MSGYVCMLRSPAFNVELISIAGMPAAATICILGRSVMSPSEYDTVMRVDLDRLRDAIRLAVAFDWTGSSDDIESFCCSANWTIVHRHKYGADFSTNMGINRPTGRCFVQDSRMRYMTFGVSDVLDPESAGSGALSLARFWDMADLLFDELGEPGRGSRNERIYFRWDLPNITIFAIGNSRENYIRLVDREFQAEQDYIDENIIARRDEI